MNKHLWCVYEIYENQFVFIRFATGFSSLFSMRIWDKQGKCVPRESAVSKREGILRNKIQRNCICCGFIEVIMISTSKALQAPFARESKNRIISISISFSSVEILHFIMIMCLRTFELTLSNNEHFCGGLGSRCHCSVSPPPSSLANERC